MPRMPPVITTHSFGDIATATRIESIENARLISSTRTTVAQNGDSPSHGLGHRRLPPIVGPLPAAEVRVGEVQQVQAADAGGSSRPG